MRSLILAMAACGFACLNDAAHAQPVPAATPTELEQRCEAGEPPACALAASPLIGVDALRARALLERGCSGADQRSCGALGLMLISGEESRRDYARAAPLLKISCENGIAAPCGALSNMLFVGAGVVADQPQAVALAERGCLLDDALSCAAFGLHMSAGDVFPRDLSRAAPALTKACVAAASRACEILENAAAFAVRGEDPRFSRAAGLELFDVACAGGRPRACTALGLFLKEGLFGPADSARAATLFERACALEHANGCASLAEAYRNGDGVLRDPSKARTFADKALDMDPGNADATRTLRRLR